ncbi:MAG: hypothetical protein NC337_10730 [Roseburia sp.]|nr:hypothetical protein [Roseburia sp.]
MENKKFRFEQLGIFYNDKTKPYHVEEAADEAFDEVHRVIEEAVLGERLAHLQSFYDDEDYSIDVGAEGAHSFILIQDEAQGISYNYINEKHANAEEQEEISGYYIPQKCVCEDTNILLDIIVTFLETGKPCERYTWAKTQEEY